jgi:hypothetical protein
MDSQISLDKLQSPQACVTVSTDDDVVVHGDAEWGSDIDDRLDHLDIRVR